MGALPAVVAVLPDHAEDVVQQVDDAVRRRHVPGIGAGRWPAVERDVVRRRSTWRVVQNDAQDVEDQVDESVGSGTCEPGDVVEVSGIGRVAPPAGRFAAGNCLEFRFVLATVAIVVGCGVKRPDVVHLSATPCEAMVTLLKWLCIVPH